MIKYVKPILFRLLFGAELIVFGYVCVYGSHGLYKLSHIKHENSYIIKNITRVQNNIERLNQTIGMWHNHSFYKEQIAREQLHMAHSDDIIYYLPDNKNKNII